MPFSVLMALAVTRTSAAMKGTVFETGAAAGPDARVFAVRPSWSYPAADWIAADPEFWRPGNRR